MNRHRICLLLICFVVPKIAFAMSCTHPSAEEGEYTSADIIAVVRPLESFKYPEESDKPKTAPFVVGCGGCVVKYQKLKFHVEYAYLRAKIDDTVTVNIPLSYPMSYTAGYEISYVAGDGQYLLTAAYDKESESYYSVGGCPGSLLPFDVRDENFMRMGMDIQKRINAVNSAQKSAKDLH